MKITEEQVQELKGQHIELFKITRRDNDYVFRFPTLKEWKDARAKDTTFSTNDKIVSTCLVFPTLKDMRVEEKTDSFLVEALGNRFRAKIVSDDDGDEGQDVILDNNSRGFRISRRGITYNFRYPTRSEWKRISGLLSVSVLSSIEVLVDSCILDVKDSDLVALKHKDVAFTELVGAPFLTVLINDWADSEGKSL